MWYIEILVILNKMTSHSHVVIYGKGIGGKVVPCILCSPIFLICSCFQFIASDLIIIYKVSKLIDNISFIRIFIRNRWQI